jgi:ElaB/YqjD/DUF883 family membrane-anchored ribosome-binding protein
MAQEEAIERTDDANYEIRGQSPEYPFVTGAAPGTSGESIGDDVDEADDEPVPADVLEARARVEATRAELSGTVDAIREKLSPHNLVAEAKEVAVAGAHTALANAVDSAKDAAATVVDSARETAVHVVEAAREKFDGMIGSAKSTVADATDGASRTLNNVRPALSGAGDTLTQTGATIVETIRLNPLPAAITGIGLAWLIMSIRQQNAAAATVTPGADYVPRPSDRFVSLADEYGGYPINSASSINNGGVYAADQPSTLDNVKGALGDARDKVTQTASSVAQNVSGAASTAAHTVSDAASSAAQTVSGAASTAAHTVSDKATVLGGQVKDYSQRAVGATGDFYQGTPLAAGALALLFGVAIGLMIPTTEPENRLMGETRDRLKDQATQQIQEVAGKVQNVATAAIGTAKNAVQQTVQQEAQNQGLVGAAA